KKSYYKMEIHKKRCKVKAEQALYQVAKLMLRCTSSSLLFRLYLLKNQNRCNNDAVSLLNAILSRRDMLRDLLMALIAALIIELSKNVVRL
ncbi:MAG: hypothetical protein ACYDHX_07735, partial [Methanothrix sp.]